MSLTPEQIAREREAFEKEFGPYPQNTYMSFKRDYEHVRKGYLARAERAAAEREQLATFVRLARRLKEEDYNADSTNIRGALDGALAKYDAILAPREQKGEG